MRHLRDDQVETFFNDGFLVVPDVFSPKEIQAMREGFDRLQDIATRLGVSGLHRGSQFVLEPLPDGSGVRIHRIVWCGAAEPVLSEFGQDRRLVRMASQLLGANEMNQLINQAHFKLPGDGVEFPWHQDSSHRRYGQGQLWRDVNGRGSYVQTVTAIDDICADNGPLQLIPGSCRLGHVPRDERDPLPPGVDPSRAVAPTLRSGSVLLFGPYTFHASLPNRSDRPRRVFINGFAYPGANSRVYPGEGSGRRLEI